MSSGNSGNAQKLRLAERILPPRRLPPGVERPVSKPRSGVGAGAENRKGWAFTTPIMLVILIFFIAPIILVFYMSASQWSLLGNNQGINFPDNYVKLLDDPVLMHSMWFTLKYTVITTLILMPLALGLALLVQESNRWNNVLRTAILLPSALGIASASLLFYALYSPQIGPLTGLLQKIGVLDQNGTILGTPDGALWATVVIVVWRFAGYYMLLTMVGLQSIPGDVYEAARIDGAGRLQQFRSITLPLLRPTLAMTWIMSIAGSLLAFDQFYILTKGGPNNSTLTVVQMIYRYAFETKKDLGLAAALSVLVLIVLVLVSFFQLRLMGVNEDED